MIDLRNPACALDPELILRGIEEILGKKIFTTSSRLDPELILRQIDKAVAPSGQTIFTAASRLSPDLAFEQVYYAIKTGGAAPSAPAWVPVNARIYIDLMNDRAWSNGAQAAIGTLLGSDPNADNGWGTTGYDPADLTADGLVYADNSPALIGSARTAVLNGATVVVRLKQITATFQTHWPLVLLASDGSEGAQFDLAIDQAVVRSFSNYSGVHGIVIPGIVASGLGVINCAAMTVNAVAGTRFDIAVNGSAAVAGNLAGEGWPPAQPMTAIVTDPGSGQYTALQAVTIYDPLSGTVGLSELSVP